MPAERVRARLHGLGHAVVAREGDKVLRADGDAVREHIHAHDARMVLERVVHHEIPAPGFLLHGGHRHDDGVLKVVLRERREKRKREQR